VGTIFGVLYGVGGLVGITIALFVTALATGSGDTFGLILRGCGAAVVLAWLILPLFAFGLDDTLDPRRLALFPHPARVLQPGLFLASAISLPALFTVLGVLAATVAEVLWLLTAAEGALRIIGSLILLLPANLGAVTLCLLLPRAILAHGAVRSSSRRTRELGGVLGMGAMLAVIYGFSVAMQSLNDTTIDLVVKYVGVAIEVFSWTPLGALFSAPLDVAQGQWPTALARLVIGVASIVLVWLWWRRSTDLALRSALIGDASSGDAKVTALVPRFVRASAFGASMGRALRYWRRDSRYLASIVIMPVMLVFFVAMGLINKGTSSMGVFGVLLVAGMSGITLMNEIGFDGPAGWVNITAGVKARDNLRGRIAAMALVAIPFILIAAIVVPLISGQAAMMPALVLMALGMMLGGWGAGALVGTLLPYPTAAPGTNPMKDKSGSSANAMISMSVGMAAVAVPQLPSIVLLVVGTVTGNDLLWIIAGGISLVVGVAALVVGLHFAERILDRRYVDLFQKVRAHV
jgi:ABC-2 type transport system permease protein